MYTVLVPGTYVCLLFLPGLLINLAVKKQNLHLTDWSDLSDKDIRLMVRAGGSMFASLKNGLPGTLAHK